MINRDRKFKIALIGDCLASGGAEKVHALLSIYFQKAGLEVHNCIFVDWIQYDYSGSLLNLGKINTHANSVKRKLSRFFELRKFIKYHNFDAVIDFRIRTGMLQEVLISKYCYPKETYYMIHSWVLEYYFPKPFWLSKFIFKNNSMIAVSKAIQEEIVSQDFTKNVFHIYNPIDLNTIVALKDKYPIYEEKFILAVGRMNEGIKQFDKLIVAYSKSVLPKEYIKLVILGEGEKLAEYRNLVLQLGLKDLVVFKGFLENPYPYYKNALFMVLSSKNEGFPNVILESLALQTPVVSFDCYSGPNEIITNGFNGLLVENQNFEKLIDAMNSLVNNQQLFSQCRQNAETSVMQFDIEIIGKKWLQLLKNKVS